MNTQIELRELMAEIEKTLVLLDRNVEFFHTFQQHDFPKLGRNVAATMVYSQIFTDFYTCLGTLLLRIAQTFENNLQAEQWHKSLLHNMTLEIEGIS